MKSGPHPPFLHTLRHHDDVVDAVLPHHPPEIIFSAGEWPLGGDVLPAVVITLHVTGGVSVCSVCV